VGRACTDAATTSASSDHRWVSDDSMGVHIFLSRAAPHTQAQERFLTDLRKTLRTRDLEPRTVGDTDFGARPLEEIRGVMMECNGLLSVAFRRLIIRNGEDRPGNQLAARIAPVDPNTWLTTPYCHLEAAMAFQLGIPILVIVEKGVRQEGALEPGVLVMEPPEFDTDPPPGSVNFFDRPKWRQLFATWEGHVREVVRTKRRPPALYDR
jgi:hypothetical protein